MISGSRWPSLKARRALGSWSLVWTNLSLEMVAESESWLLPPTSTRVSAVTRSSRSSVDSSRISYSSSSSCVRLKVHRIEIFIWLSILKFVIFLCQSNQNIKILQKKKNLIRPVLEEVRFFRVVLRLRGMEKFLSKVKKIFFFLLWTLCMSQY